MPTPDQIQFSDLPPGASVVSAPTAQQVAQQTVSTALAQPNTAQPTPAPNQPQAQFSDLPAGATVVSAPKLAQSQNQDQPKPGFLSTVGSDIGDAAKNLVKLPLSVASYATLDRPSAEAAQAVADANEAHKMGVYHKFAQDFHAGNYGKAIYGLTELFNPETEDPNDPLQQVMKSQWDSSKQAKDLAVEAVKNKNYAAAVQHAAGVLPVASQVDAAMENYRKDPSRENLAHIVTSAIPAFIPAIAHGAGAVVEAMQDLSKGEGMVSPLAPVNVDMAGTPVPVRASVANPTLGARVAESLATKEPLQQFDVTQTQPAARAAVAKIAEESVTKPTFEALRQAETTGAKTITITPGDIAAEAAKSGKTLDDVIDEHIQKLTDEANIKVQDVGKYWDDTLRDTKGDFAQAYRNVKNELSRFYQKADLHGMKDGLGENAFTKAQREQQAAFNAGNVDAEDAAITRQRELFDKANGDGMYDEVKKQYPKLDAIDAINAKFTARAVVKNTPSQFLKNLPAGQFDRGIIDGAALRTAVRELRADGTFAKAGVGDTQVLQLQRLGDLLERSKVRPDTIPAGFFGKIGSGVKTMTAGNQLAYLMTHADALDGVVKYLKGVGPASTAVGAAANLMTQPTHQYDESSGQVIPIQ